MEGMMFMEFEEAYERLLKIYQKHLRRHRGNPDSRQMCCIWSTSNPPDVLLGTRPIADIEKAFGVELTEDDALKLYDMELGDAAKKLVEVKDK